MHFWHQNVDCFSVYASLVNVKSLKPTLLQPKNKKRRLDTLDMLFLFDNMPDEKEIHRNMFIQ